MKFYLTVETQERIKNTFLNLNLFYILDIEQVICEYGLDISKPHNRFLLSQEIEKIIVAQTKSKRLEGIIYINKNISEQLYHNLKKKFAGVPSIEKFILIDNGNASKHRELFDVFEEVYFYQRFRKNKIVDYTVQIPELDEQQLSGQFQDVEEIIS